MGLWIETTHWRVRETETGNAVTWLIKGTKLLTMSASDSHRTLEYRSVSNIDSRIVGCTLNHTHYRRVTIFTWCLSLTPTTVHVNDYVRLYLPRESNVHAKYQIQAWPEHNLYEPLAVSLELYLLFWISVSTASEKLVYTVLVIATTVLCSSTFMYSFACIYFKCLFMFIFYCF
jgi:hypothetical protein